MKSEQTIKHGAAWTAPVGLAGFAGRVLAGAVALLLISGGLSAAWAITGGEVDQNNAYPNVGAVVIVPPAAWTPGPMALGSGTLIHPRVLLTAGHITRILEQLPSTIPLTYVSFEPYSLNPDSWLEVEAGITHPNYIPRADPSAFANDVGVIILKNPVSGVPLADLPYAGLLDDLKQAGLLQEPGEGPVPFRVVGYGGTMKWPPEVFIPSDGWRRFTDSDCLNVQHGWLHLLQNPAAGNGGIIWGDSGGPAFWIAPDGTRTVVAVTSWSISNVGTSFHWRVDLPETLDFIDQVLRALEGP